MESLAGLRDKTTSAGPQYRNLLGVIIGAFWGPSRGQILPCREMLTERHCKKAIAEMTSELFPHADRRA